jgi:hypothetical protein
MAGPIRITAIANTGGATANIRAMDNSVGRLSARFSKLKVPALLAGAGVVALGGGLLKLAQGAAEDEKAQAVLAKTLKNTAHATDAQVKSVEDYISKTGKATGITDDQMRPALANLLRATHDVGRAQGLMNLAMDVSTGTGKDLGAVTQALAKAQLGSTGALGKLGIATKDASGKALSFDQIQKNLAKTFTGQAAAAANTTAGRFDRLRLIMSEAGETIGSKVLPVLLSVAGFLLNKVVPAVSRFGSLMAGIFQARVLPVLQRFGGFLRDTASPAVVTFGQKLAANVVPVVQNLVVAFTPLVKSIGAQLPAVFRVAQDVLSKFGGVLTGTVLPAFRSFTEFLRNNQTLVGALAVGIGAVVAALKIYQGVLAVITIATKAWAVVQAALNVVMALNPIAVVVLAVIGLAAAIIYAYKHSEKFRQIVDGAFRAVSTVVTKVVGGVVDFFRSRWKLLPLLLLGPIGLVLIIFKGLPGKIASAVGNTAKTLYQKGRGFIVGLVSGVASYLATLALKIGGIQVGVLRWIGNTALTLYQKGRGLIIGLVSGINSFLGTLSAKISGIKSSAARWIGDLGGALVHAGAQLIQGLINGIESKISALRDKVSNVAGFVKNLFPGSPVKEGPLRAWNNGGAGKRLMDQLIAGIRARQAAVARAVSNVSGLINTSIEGGFAARPSVALAAGAGSPFTASAAAAPIQINVYALQQGPEVGRQVVKAIQAYELGGAGTRWRS